MMQIIPATGQQIATELNWPPLFDAEDLYRPLVSVRFGSYYLHKTRDMLGGSVYGGLAAYNAGLRHADVWKSAGGNIRNAIAFPETKAYVLKVARGRDRYAALYPKAFPGWVVK